MGPKIVGTGTQSIDRLASVLENGSFERFLHRMRTGAERLDGRSLWNVNSTAQGGGVAEMLASLIPYAKASGWDVRWAVIGGDDDFFRVTKGLHNALHGASAPEDTWSEGAYEVYSRITNANAERLLEVVRPGDVVFVHDPQTAGLIAPLASHGANVSWQCHVGTDRPNDHTARAWTFLRPFVQRAERYVFSREAYLWDGLDPQRLRVVPPTIDVFSTKNAPLSEIQARRILVRSGVIDGRPERAPFLRPDGNIGIVRRRVDRVGGPAPIPPHARIVLEVSRWDHLKDPLGFLRMYAGHLTDLDDVHLVYAGPAAGEVDDDPEGACVLRRCATYWRGLPADVRRRVHLLSVPMDDLDENAAIVSALQHRADVVVQKSIQEGFGLTVTEAMWKARPVVASRTGGIQDQIEHGRSGILIDDPRDDAAFARAVRALLADPDRARRYGRAARRRVRDRFLHPRQLSQHADLIEELTR